jgi:hypothetical protein
MAWGNYRRGRPVATTPLWISLMLSKVGNTMYGQSVGFTSNLVCNCSEGNYPRTLFLFPVTDKDVVYTFLFPVTHKYIVYTFLFPVTHKYIVYTFHRLHTMVSSSSLHDMQLGFSSFLKRVE